MDERRWITPWVKTRLRQIRDAKTKETIAGVVVDVYVSPYDIPEKMRGYFDDDKNRFVIEFRYMTDEPTEDAKENDHVVLRVGVKTKRIYAIEIDAVAVSMEGVPSFEHLEQQALEAIRNYANQHPDASRENLRAATAALEEKGDSVFGHLSP